jgi:hypothetical protein
MNIERPGSPSATTVAPASKRRSTSIETKRSRLASERPPKKGVASKNAFRSGELTAIDLIYSGSQRRQAGQARLVARGVSGCRSSRHRPDHCAAEFGRYRGIAGKRTSRAISDPLPGQARRAGTHKQAVSADNCQLDDGEVYLHVTPRGLFGSTDLMAVASAAVLSSRNGPSQRPPLRSETIAHVPS